MQAVSTNPKFDKGMPYLSAMPGGRPPTKPQSKFGQRLAAVRKQRGLSQTQFGKLLGLSREMVAYYERCAKSPTVAFIEKIATDLQVPAADLLAMDIKRPRQPGPPSELEARLVLIRRLSRERQKFVLQFLDTVLRDSGVNEHRKAA
jgi:transcriptional regulator with XRE-family HTH domain